MDIMVKHMTVFGGVLGWLLGELDGFLYALVVFVILDYLTGIMAAIVEKRLSSEQGFKGIFKKITLFTLVALAHIIDNEILKKGGAVRMAVIFFYLANEGLSILENVTRMGVNVPPQLRSVLEKINEKEVK
ncbi:phage holin family protein [Tuanshanicoccus lijuaniae]|uniref:phage holin family protein n=1 Tax=Aerococcaceae bacterium zg-1292 TaxID=2774330 RepID=UPI0019361D77|nr:phage holin family protein [Aerococcaceae bacterium zg-1292]QQA38062.1 phage holin family protein [Aerococcaceae bacterium zg-1292]